MRGSVAPAPVAWVFFLLGLAGNAPQGHRVGLQSGRTNGCTAVAAFTKAAIGNALLGGRNVVDFGQFPLLQGD